MSEAYLLDTNVICALADANHSSHLPVRQRFQEMDPQFVLLPSMAVAEIEFGMARAPNIKPEKRAELRQFIRRFEQLPFDQNCVLPYSIVRAERGECMGLSVNGTGELVTTKSIQSSCTRKLPAANWVLMNQILLSPA